MSARTGKARPHTRSKAPAQSARRQTGRSAGLTPKQQRFVLEYPKDCNASKAAVRAGYSENGAQQAGSRLLSNVVVFEAVQAAIQAHLANLDLAVDRVIQEAARIGVSDVGDLFDDETGEILHPQQMPDNVRKAIASIKVTYASKDDGPQLVTTEIKLWDKLRGLELLAKLKGLLRNIHEHTGDGLARVHVYLPNNQRGPDAGGQAAGGA